MMRLNTAILLVASLLISPFALAISAHDLLIEADRARGGGDFGLSWYATVTTFENGESSSREFLVKAQGDDAFVEAKAPSRNLGEVYLFNSRNMWFYKPSLKKPVPVSSRQKLSGQTANGDIASTNYVKNYAAVIEKQVDHDGHPAYVLLLTAKGNDLTYDKVRYYIDAKTKLALKAEFLNIQGEILKTGYLKYKNKLTVNGKTGIFVSELRIVDAFNSKNTSTITYAQVKAAKFNKSLFNVNNISR